MKITHGKPIKAHGFGLSGRHQAWLYSSFGVLFISGVLWLVLRWFSRPHGDFGESAHPAEPWLLKAHGAGAMAALVILGTLIPGHVRRGWNANRNRFSGVELLILNGLMILTGYGLYYFGDEILRPAISAAHWITGLLFPAFLLWHIVRGRKLRKRQP